MINVSKPNLPALSEYISYLEGIWDRNWLTNNGPLVNELEDALRNYLKLNNLLFLSNGTIAIQLAIRALNLKGSIITTPFSYVATTNTIIWENCTPIFADINPDSFNIDPDKIEASITNDTTAILATHVYGNPCEIDAIQTIADKNNLKVIYDAAHCFGTKYKGKSVFEYGDISTTSFHATKLFHTIEGGAVFSQNKDLIDKIGYLRNFGHTSPVDFISAGINGKNSEFHAAMGLCNLKIINNILEDRKLKTSFYSNFLDFSGKKIRTLKITANTEYNYAYYPLVFETENALLLAQDALNANYIYPRRYFYPSLNKLNYIKANECAISEDVSKRVLCLPLYYNIRKEEIELICKLINNTI